jgi:hypothetical protein
VKTTLFITNIRLVCKLRAVAQRTLLLQFTQVKSFVVHGSELEETVNTISSSNDLFFPLIPGEHKPETIQHLDILNVFWLSSDPGRGSYCQAFDEISLDKMSLDEMSFNKM